MKYLIFILKFYLLTVDGSALEDNIGSGGAGGGCLIFLGKAGGISLLVLLLVLSG